MNHDVNDTFTIGKFANNNRPAWTMQISMGYTVYKLMGECNTILGAYTLCRHIEKCCTRPLKCKICK